MGCGRSATRKDPVGKRNITTYTHLFEEIAKGRKLVVYEDNVLDVDSFIAIHPGGEEVFKSMIGIHYFKLRLCRM